MEKTDDYDKEINFCTVGNVATHPDYEGRGYMNILFNQAMEIVKEEKYDACRLGGDRARYLRFGFELCGGNYSYYITPKNTKKSLLGGYGQNTSVYEIFLNDEKSLMIISSYSRGIFFWLFRFTKLKEYFLSSKLSSFKPGIIINPFISIASFL